MARPSFAKIMKQARLEMRMPQHELAGKLKTSQAFISNLENGKLEIDPVMKKKISKILKIRRKSGRSTQEEVDRDDVGAFASWLREAVEGSEMAVSEIAENAGVTQQTIYNILSGRIENPQTSTKKNLESALGKSMSSATLREIEKQEKAGAIGQLTDFEPYDDDNLPSDPGVYVFYDISERPIYVGQGSNIRKRILDHAEKFWFKSPIVETASFIRVEDSNLRKNLEEALIKFMKSNAVINKKNVDR